MPVSKFFAVVTSLGEGIDCFKSGSAPCGFCDLLRVGQNFFYMLLEIGLVAAVGVIVYGAIMLIVSHGNENLLKKGKEAITGAVIGMILALGGWVIINTVFYILTGASGSWSSIECTSSPVIPIEILPTSTEATGGFTYAKVATNGYYSCSTSSCDSIAGACANAYCFSLISSDNCGNPYPSLTEVYGYKLNSEIFAHCYGTSTECASHQPAPPPPLEYGCTEVKIDNYSGPAAGQCPVANLSSSYGSLGVQWTVPDSLPQVKNNVAKLRTEFNKMVDLLGQLGIITDATSVYRPYEYQKHLWEIWSKCNDSHIADCDNSDTAVGNNCITLWNELNTEKNDHFPSGLPSVVAGPACSAPHVRGTGIDIVLSCPRSADPNLCFIPQQNNMPTYFHIKFNGNSSTNFGNEVNNYLRGRHNQFNNDIYNINDLLDKANIDIRWQGIHGDEVHFNLQNPPGGYNPPCQLPSP